MRHPVDPAFTATHCRLLVQDFCKLLLPGPCVEPAKPALFQKLNHMRGRCFPRRGASWKLEPRESDLRTCTGAFCRPL